MKISAAIREYLIEIEVRKYTPKTIRGYRNSLNLFLRFCEQEAHIQEVDCYDKGSDWSRKARFSTRPNWALNNDGAFRHFLAEVFSRRCCLIGRFFLCVHQSYKFFGKKAVTKSLQLLTEGIISPQKGKAVCGQYGAAAVLAAG